MEVIFLVLVNIIIIIAVYLYNIRRFYIIEVGSETKVSEKSEFEGTMLL